jgi:hypothetical protein
MHTELGAVQAQFMVELAGLALERNGHAPGAQISMDLEQVLTVGTIIWPRADISKVYQHDHNRITEEGAEAVALVVAHQHCAWRVVRRMQRGEHADWLLRDSKGGMHKTVALEVSGVDRGRVNQRLSEKLIQVAKIRNAQQRWACVVGFEEPTAVMRFAAEALHG